MLLLGKKKHEPTQGVDQTHVHGPAQLALPLHNLLQQRGVPQGGQKQRRVSMSSLHELQLDWIFIVACV